MNDLGNALRGRYDVTGNESDLENAVRVLAAALSTAPADSALSATLRANLGAAERDKYAASQSLSSLDMAIRHLTAAVQMKLHGRPRPGAAPVRAGAGDEGPVRALSPGGWP